MLSMTGTGIRPVAIGTCGTIATGAAEAVGAAGVGFSGSACRFSRSSQAPTARMMRALANVSQRIIDVGGAADARGTRARVGTGTNARLVANKAGAGVFRYNIAAAITSVALICSASSISARIASGEAVARVLAAARMRTAPIAPASPCVHTNTRSPLRKSSFSTINCVCSPCSYMASLPLRIR